MTSPDHKAGYFSGGYVREGLVDQPDVFCCDVNLKGSHFIFLSLRYNKIHSLSNFWSLSGNGNQHTHRWEFVGRLVGFWLLIILTFACLVGDFLRILPWDSWWRPPSGRIFLWLLQTTEQTNLSKGFEFFFSRTVWHLDIGKWDIW